MEAMKWVGSGVRTFGQMPQQSLNMETTAEISLSHWDNDKSYEEFAHQFLNEKDRESQFPLFVMG